MSNPIICASETRDVFFSQSYYLYAIFEQHSLTQTLLRLNY